ncbi:MAG: DegT/DnrJ/EryC1/StrS family aminotransferase [Candidatus Levybacteria bacterium]|nr:DegT/DnrJ/EryC1/StrS family aminotransferase [Candidatus Levybacteria bacterium]
MKKVKNITGIKVPFFPAVLEYESIKNEMHLALDKVGKSGNLILGQNVQELEAQLSKLLQVKYAVGCSSGTDAITLSLKALGLDNKDEVFVPANAYPTIFGVALSGVKPVLVDVQATTGNMDLNLLEKAITKKSKAVIVVHLYGLSADIKEIKRICKKRNLYLIEDCAQAFGASYAGEKVGSFGDAATFSFYPTKNLGALGDAGAVVTSNTHVYNMLKMYRVYGEKTRYDSHLVGKNSRIDELQAAFLLAKMKHYKKWITRKKKLSNIYLSELSNVKYIHLPPILDDREHTFHLFVIKARKRNQLKKWLYSKGIESTIHYPIPIHRTHVFRKLGKRGSFPEAEKWSQKALSLPLHAFLTEDQIYYVIKMIKAFYYINNK